MDWKSDWTFETSEPTGPCGRLIVANARFRLLAQPPVVPYFFRSCRVRQEYPGKPLQYVILGDTRRRHARLILTGDFGRLLLPHRPECAWRPEP